MQVSHQPKIFVAGHRGMVGSAIVRRLQAEGYGNIATRTRAELDLLDQAAVHRFLAEAKPDYVFIAAAKVGGIQANNLYNALDEIDGIERYRISSIEPNLLTEEIISFVAESKKFVPYFHIPLQSGNDKILKSMRRRYQRDLYQQRVEWIKKIIPHCCIGVDVIVGFPGESEIDFMDSYHFIQQLDISYLHVFTYSERANTPAFDMIDPVPMEVRRQRNEMMRILSHKKKTAFSNPFLGTIRPVLFEQAKEKGMMSGFTDNYIKVSLPLENSFINQISNVRLGHYDENFDCIISEHLMEKNKKTCDHTPK